MASDTAEDQSKPRESAASKVLAAIKQDITCGSLKPGERLDEVKLAGRLGVSRTPIREAFNQLIAQKILTNTKGRGVRVASYTKEELSEVFEVMFEIEIACARLVAQRLTFLARSEIEAAQQTCVEAAETGDRLDYIRANEDLHAAIYRATGNQVMEDLANEFRSRTGPFRARRFESREERISSAKSHEKLLATIFSADSDAAMEGMREHMSASLLQTLALN